MTLTELKYIVTVARTKHFGKAADECFVSQPTLSVGIMKLEDGLGITIFERGRSEVKVTPIGQAIINQAMNVLSECEVLKNIAVADKHQLRDPIKISSTYTIGKYLFPHLIRQVYNLSPESSVVLNQDYHEQLVGKLLNKELDLLLLATNVVNTNDANNSYLYNLDSASTCLSNPDLCFQPVLQEDLYLLVGNNKYNSENIKLKDINLSELSLLNKQHCLHNQSLSINPEWYECKDSLKDSSIDSLESLYAQVKLSSSIAIIPALFSLDLKQKPDDNVKIVLFDKPAPSRILSLVWRNDFSRVHVVETFKHALRAINIPGLQVII